MASRARTTATCDECGGAPIKARGKCNRCYLRELRSTKRDAINEANRKTYAERRTTIRLNSREKQIVAWYDAEVARAGTDLERPRVGQVLVEFWQIQGALALLTKLHSRRPETMLYDPDYEFTGGLLRCLEAGRDALGLNRRAA